MFSISVVIPNYNGEELLRANIPSVLAALKQSAVEYEVIVPDDCSNDSSVQLLKKYFPSVLIIESTKNLGFSSNINKGLRKAKKDLICILNSDIHLDKNYFEYKLAHFCDSNTFAVSGAIYDPVSKQLCEHDLSVKQNFWGIIQSTQTKNYSFKKTIPVYGLSGANALISRNKIQQIQYFEELFSPYYGEDVELNLRAWRSGWLCHYEPRAICYHEGSATIKKHSTKKHVRLISRRNKLTFHFLHLDGVQRFKFKIKLCLDLLTRWLIYDLSFYKAFFMFYSLLPAIRDKRKAVRYKFSTQECLKRIDQIQKKQISHG